MKTSAKDPFLNIFGWKKSDFKKRAKEKKSIGEILRKLEWANFFHSLWPFG